MSSHVLIFLISCRAFVSSLLLRPSYVEKCSDSASDYCGSSALLHHTKSVTYPLWEDPEAISWMDIHEGGSVDYDKLGLTHVRFNVLRGFGEVKLFTGR